MKRTGLLFVLSGPSGVGKGSILARALPDLPEMRKSVSATTRPPRPEEVEGRDYFFRSRDEFHEMVGADQLLEWAKVFEHFYGTPREWVDEILSQGQDVVLEIDVQGTLQVRQKCQAAILIFVAPPSWQELRSRLLSRKTEDEASVARRLEGAKRELASLPHYDYVIVNDQLEKAADQFKSLVMAERCRPGRVDLSRLEGDGG